MVSEWAAFNARIYSLEQDKEVPPTSKAESEKPTNWGKVARYAEELKELKFKVEQARLSPQHYGMLIDMPDLMGEPENYMTYEEYQAEQKRLIQEQAEAARDNVVSFLEHAAKGGATFEAL